MSSLPILVPHNCIFGWPIRLKKGYKVSTVVDLEFPKWEDLFAEKVSQVHNLSTVYTLAINSILLEIDDVITLMCDFNMRAINVRMGSSFYVCESWQNENQARVASVI